ncbi:TPA: glycosyltransferase family 10 [Campylobacter jejuni]
MKEIRIKIVDWWTRDYKHNFIIKQLQSRYKIIFSENPDYLIFSCFGKEHLKYDNCIKIFYCGENERADYNLTDYSIDFDYIDFSDRHLRLPSFLRRGYQQILKYNQKIDSERIKKSFRNNFCSFIVDNSNEKYNPRGMFFDKLSLYKKVDSYGKYKNNTADKKILKRLSDDKHEILLKYKFNICFENSSYPGYLTEKLFDAFFAGCIPIYWGDTSLNNIEICKEYIINPKSYINAHDFGTLDELVEEVKRIDKDDKVYHAMLSEPILLNDFDFVKFYTSKLNSFLDNIFLQDKDKAFRRSQSQRSQSYISRLLSYQNIQDSNKVLNKTIKEKDNIINSNINHINQLQSNIQEKSTQLNQAQSKLSFQTKYGTAKTRIQNQLSYKLGQAMIVNSKSFLGYIRMPFVLSYIKDKHKQEQKNYQEKVKKDPSLKLLPLESYPDYQEALKEKECFTYKLGEALIKANKTWHKGGYAKMWFEIGKLKREFRNKKI